MLGSSAKFTLCSYPYNYLIIEDCFETNAAYGLSSVFNDLIAMNALYRPGPIAYIPSFIKRKNDAHWGYSKMSHNRMRLKN